MTRPDAPGPLRRRGPRPLLLQLMLAMRTSPDSPPVWPPSKPASPSSNGGCDPPHRPGPSDASPDAADATLADHRALIAGIAAYRRHPWHRDLPDPPVLWQEGSARLLDYAAGEGGPAVLFVPSLVNRAYVLDLAPRHSMLRFLAGEGVRPLLLDWGAPGETERRFTLSDYVTGPLERALAAITEPVVLAGYCMGGLLALAAARRRAEQVRALALLATPWDFHAGYGARAAALAGVPDLLEPAMTSGTLPVDALQALFTFLDPGGIARKYREFARIDQASERARLFVALEDWLSDGVPLAAPVARECLVDWYGGNRPARGAWRVAGQRVDPGAIDVPAFVAIPGRDLIVPPGSARPLARALVGARLIEPAAGHIGMVAGSRAETALWRPLLAWLRELS